MLVRYVNIFYSASNINDTKTKKISSREEFCPPRNCYGYQFFDRKEVAIGKNILKSLALNYSKTFLVGKKYSVEEIEKLWPEIPIDNFREFGYGCLTQTGDWFPADEEYFEIVEK